MNVAFVHNKWFPYSSERPFKGNAGGAALTNIAIIQEGEKRGHKIDRIFAYENRDNHAVYKDYLKYPIEKPDLLIISHIPKFKKKEFLSQIMNGCRYIRWDHAYDFCKNGVSNMCENVCFNIKCRKCEAAYNYGLHSHAILSIFQSPLHQNIQQNILKYKSPNSFILPAPIDTELFRPNDNMKRDEKLYLIVGSVMKHKGIDNIIEFIDKKNDCKFVFIGNCKKYIDVLNKKPNITLIQNLDNYKLPEYYNIAKYYIHMPLWWEPSSRSTMEAILMGCELVINEKVGTMTYDFIQEMKKPKNGIVKFTIEEREKIRSIVKEAPTRMWEKIEEVYKGNNPYVKAKN